jgi:hypothetical protein
MTLGPDLFFMLKIDKTITSVTTVSGPSYTKACGHGTLVDLVSFWYDFDLKVTSQLWGSMIIVVFVAIVWLENVSVTFWHWKVGGYPVIVNSIQLEIRILSNIMFIFKDTQKQYPWSCWWWGTVNQLLFTANVFCDSYVVNWFAGSYFHDWASSLIWYFMQYLVCNEKYSRLWSPREPCKYFCTWIKVNLRYCSIPKCGGNSQICFYIHTTQKLKKILHKKEKSPYGFQVHTYLWYLFLNQVNGAVSCQNQSTT